MKYIGLVFLLLTTTVSAQIKITDSLTLEPVPFTHIVASDGSIGVVSDLEGVIKDIDIQYLLKDSSTNFTIQHVAYSSKQINKLQLLNGKEVSLSPRNIDLNEIVVISHAKDYDYTALQAFFRSYVLQNNEPKFYVDGIVTYYATQAKDTLFWQEHNAILPDSAILKALEKYQAKQKDSIIIRNSKQYEAHIKRLYTPNLSLMASTGLTRDFYTFNHNTNSVNRYVSHLLQRNLRGILKQQIGIYLYQTFVSTPLEENASEWLLLNKNGIHSKINPLIVNKYNSTYLFGIADRQISDFKTGNHLDFMRLHTIRNDGHYAKSVLIEEELAKADLSNKNNWFNYLQLYSMELLMHKGTNTYNPFKKDIKQYNLTEEKQPLIIDRNRSWVKYLFNPDAEYQRHILNENLSDEEQRYLKRSAYWSWLNLVSPQLYGIPKFKLNEKNSFTFSINYLRTPFGEMFGQNLWLMHDYSQLHGFFVKQYRNYEKTTFGIGYKLYDVSLLRNLYSTTLFDIWQQPTDFKFKTNSTFMGFYINQLFEYQLLPHKYINRNNLSIFVGFDYKTKGYMPESYFMNKSFNIKVGGKINLN